MPVGGFDLFLESGSYALLEDGTSGVLLEGAPGGSGTFRVQRSEVPVKLPAGIAVDLVGSGTAWTQGGTTFTLSGVAGATVLVKVVQDDGIHARLVIATGAASGTLTISDGNSTATVAVKNYRRPKWFPGL